MEFRYEFDVNVPREYAFERFNNVQDISASLPANIVLRPEKGAYEFSEGSVWVVKAQRSGRNFVIRNKIVKNEAPSQLLIDSKSNRLHSDITIDFIEKTEETCMIQTNFVISPKGLLGRILLQSIKASKSRVLGSLDKGTEHLTEMLERDYAESKA